MASAALVVAGLGLVAGTAADAGASGARSHRPAAPAADVTARCLDAKDVTTLTGRRSGGFKGDVAAGETVDATGAWWLQAGNWPVTFGGGSGGCWVGGRVVGTWAQSTPWSSFHHTTGLAFTNPNFTVDGLRVHNIGDGIGVRAGADHFTVTGVHVSFIHDDCVQNDELYTGVIEDSLLDGCYVGFSARPSKGQSAEGRTATETIRGNVVRLQPMPTVYKGRAPGNGGFFKWDEQGRAPRLVVRDNVFRVDQRPNHQTLGLPAGYHYECSNNVVVWLGKGKYPDRLPKCFTVTRDRRVWDKAVADWYAAHPGNP